MNNRYTVVALDGTWRVVDTRRTPYAWCVATCENQSDANRIAELLNLHGGSF